MLRCTKAMAGIFALAVLALASLPAYAGNVNVDELSFNSEKELLLWLKELAKDEPLAVESVYNQLMNSDSYVDADACKVTTLTPASISITSPFKIKVYQITIDVTLANCGMVICSTMGFDLTWNPGPNAGSILIGPFPAEPIQQFCVGANVVSKGFLILTKDAPNGSYAIKVKVGGFGYALYLDIPVTISR